MINQTFYNINSEKRNKILSTIKKELIKNGWEKSTPTLSELPYKGDTIVGNDV